MLRRVSHENVELSRRFVEAWNSRDLDGILDFAAPDVEFVNSPTAIEPGTRRGHDELAAVLRTQWEMLTDGRQEIDRVYDRGDEVIALGRLSRRLPGSETRIEDRILASCEFRDGLLIRTRILGFGADEVEEALNAHGLDP